eukprot:TRINITY_DN6606_c0_g3_i4.p1 TRINITY_DN6606_c0_g3~~TRINITY_DN6606_c0_g3_i4.p1  ORF type:complete len:381 (+),score=74.42 TRINITY_DN6606_c0_g3_i4:190-1332(+)
MVDVQTIKVDPMEKTEKNPFKIHATRVINEANRKEAMKRKRNNRGGGGIKKGADKKGGARSTSRFRGVTHHCRTGRWEAHIWEEGKQIYLGSFNSEEQAALAYDLAAIKCRGQDATTNYDVQNYQYELNNLESITKDDLILSLRRQSKGYHKNSSQFKGVTKHQKGKWEARIGQMVGKKYKYIGLFKTEVEAAIAYDKEAVMFKGLEAQTNFDISNYLDLLNEEDRNKIEKEMNQQQIKGDNSTMIEGSDEPTPTTIFGFSSMISPLTPDGTPAIQSVPQMGAWDHQFVPPNFSAPLFSQQDLHFQMLDQNINNELNNTENQFIGSTENQFINNQFNFISPYQQIADQIGSNKKVGEEDGQSCQDNSELFFGQQPPILLF